MKLFQMYSGNVVASFWTTVFGVDPGEVPDGARMDFILTNAPRSWGVFVMLGIVAGLVYFCFRLYRAEADACPPRIKNVLAGLRIAVLLLLALVFLGPAITFTRELKIEPHILFMRDASTSMNTPDRYIDEDQAKRVAKFTKQSLQEVRNQQPSRVNLLEKAVTPRMVRDIQKKGKLRVYHFAEEAVLIKDQAQDVEEIDEDDESEWEELPPLEATGASTDIHHALREGLADKSTSAIVLFTDGQHTAPGELLDVAGDASDRGVPIFVVGIGDPVPPRNLQVVEMIADTQVWLNDPFEIRAVISAQGVGDESISVELIEKSTENEGEDLAVLETKEVVLPAEDGNTRVSFTYKPTKPGRHAYAVRVQQLDNELSESDNEAPAPVLVNVLDESARVLLVSGRPSWEYRDLVKLLTREKFINVSAWLQTLDPSRVQAGNVPIRAFPNGKSELFEYDVILLLDPDPNGLDPEWVDLLKKFAREHAGGILYMPAPRNAGRFLANPASGGIKDILPVRFGDVGSMEVSSLLSMYNQDWPLGILRSNVDHPMMSFYQDEESSFQQWKNLNGIYWSFPAAEPKPSARTLIQHTNPNLTQNDTARPLLVTGQYGSGRTVYVGFNGTWRWRSKGRDAEFYNRFWVQAIRYLVKGRALEAEGRGFIETEKETYQIGERISLSAKLRDKNYNDLEVEGVEANVLIGEETFDDLVFNPVPGDPGRYQAGLIGTRAGLHRVRIVGENEEGEPVKIEKEFAVIPPNLETRAVWLNQKPLQAMAQLSGGKYFHIDEVKDLVKAIPNRIRTIENQSPPKPVWDTSRMLILLVVLLGFEWALRKRFKLL